MRNVLIVIVLSLLVVSGGFFIYKKLSFNTDEYINQQVKNLSYIKIKLVEVRILTVDLTKLDPSELDFVNKKSDIFNQLKAANRDLATSLNSYKEDRGGFKALSYKALRERRINKKYNIKNITSNAEDTSKFVYTLIKDNEAIQGTTKAIYGIYLPSDYEQYNIDISNYYEGELQDKNIFTEVKGEVESIDRRKFNTKELIIRLDQVQVLFDDCIEEIGKETIAFDDIEVCEEALSVDELKELTYQMELSYLASENTMEAIVKLTNTTYELEEAINNMVNN